MRSLVKKIIIIKSQMGREYSVGPHSKLVIFVLNLIVLHGTYYYIFVKYNLFIFIIYANL